MPESIKTLAELAFMYGTDKLEHGYIPFYEKYLPTNPKKILEIGVKEGRSIRMWQQYFPNAEVHGLDLFEEFPIPDIPGAIFHKGNQCDWRVLEELRKENFDLVIDDGSHNSRDQMITFFGLFIEGMAYVIEDLHCCADPFYQQQMPLCATSASLFSSMEDPSFNIVKSQNIILIKC